MTGYELPSLSKTAHKFKIQIECESTRSALSNGANQHEIGLLFFFLMANTPLFCQCPHPKTKSKSSSRDFTSLLLVVGARNFRWYRAKPIKPARYFAPERSSNRLLRNKYSGYRRQTQSYSRTETPHHPHPHEFRIPPPVQTSTNPRAANIFPASPDRTGPNPAGINSLKVCAVLHGRKPTSL